MLAPPQWLEANLALTPSRCGEAALLCRSADAALLAPRPDDDYYIWTRQLDVDPHEHPFLELIWSVERFLKAPLWMSMIAPIARSSY